jgi:hypothetical protein
MHIVYWAHSYREEDAPINRHFGMLIEEAEKMIFNFDPPSMTVNESKLQQNLSCCDGMVAVLPWRATGPSQYILFEIALALRSRKPVVVFIDERLPDDILPPRIMQQRFSHRTYFRQVREQIQALRLLKVYMGDPPPTRYQPTTNQRSCGGVGLSVLTAKEREEVALFVESRGYRFIWLEDVHFDNPLAFDQFEHLAVLKVVLRCADMQGVSTLYWTGAIGGASLPAISFTTQSDYPFNPSFPLDFQPRQVNTSNSPPLGEVLNTEFDLFEQNFLSAQKQETIERYVRMQVEAGALAGNYEASTRNLYIGAIMGDQYNIHGQAAAVGPDAHVHDISFNQVWNQLEGKVDLAKLADDLAVLQKEMERNATEPGEKLAVGAVAAAEQSARQKDGPKVMEYLKVAGKWALTISQKIGVSLATEALKSAIGF